jgi:DNA-binding protein HU-beta
MNKAELIEKMAGDTKLSKAAVKSVLESFIDSVQGALKKNNSVVLTGFGTFTVIQRKGRTGVNPASGERMTIPAKRVPKFRAGKQLKDIVA